MKKSNPKPAKTGTTVAAIGIGIGIGIVGLYELVLKDALIPARPPVKK